MSEERRQRTPAVSDTAAEEHNQPTPFAVISSYMTRPEADETSGEEEGRRDADRAFGKPVQGDTAESPDEEF